MILKKKQKENMTTEGQKGNFIDNNTVTFISNFVNNRIGKVSM